MTGRTTAIVALLTLALGSGIGYLKFVSPALAERNKLQDQNTQLTRQANDLNTEVAAIQARVNSMAMSSISYFDLTPYTENKKRIMEAKTVETLASLTQILDDNHIKVNGLTPTGETQGLNKPIPTPPPASPGASAAPAAAAATPTPTPVPGATPPPPPISLTHKTFALEIEGEYPDLIKALSEIQSLPRAISINDYKVRLVHDPEKKEDLKPGENPSPSLLAMQFDMSITFLMDAGGLMTAPAPSLAPSAGPAHAASLLAWLGDMACPPAVAAEGWPVRPSGTRPVAPVVRQPFGRQPRPVPHRRRAAAAHGPNALKEVRWIDGALELHTVSGRTPRYHVVGAHPGFMVLQLDHTITRGTVFFHPVGPGVQQIMALPAPHDPGATHLVVKAGPGTRFHLAPGAGARLRIGIDAPADARTDAVQAALAGPPAPHPTATAPAAKPAPAVAAKPPVGKPERPAEPSRPVVALLPAHAAAHPAVPSTAPVAVGAHAAPPAGDSALQIVVKPREAAPLLDAANTALAPDRDQVPPEAEQAWERRQLTKVETTFRTDGPAKPVEAPDVAQTVVAVPVPEAHPPVVAPLRPAAAPVQAPPAHPAITHPAPMHQAVAPHVATHPVAVPVHHPAPVPVPVAASARASAGELTHLDGAAIAHGDLVINTHGAPPRFEVLGGNQHLLLLGVEHMPTAGRGRLIPVGHEGIKQIRAALYDNRTYMTHLAIDTDGSVRLEPIVGADGQLHLHVRPFGKAGRPHPATAVQTGSVPTGTTVTADVGTVTPGLTLEGVPNAVPPSRRPVAHPAPKTRMVKPPARVVMHPAPVHHPAPHPHVPTAPRVVTAPTATPTPMAIPHEGAPAPHAPVQTAAKPVPHAVPMAPGATPTPMAPAPTHGEVLFEGRHMERLPAPRQHFPIEKDRITGRQNPFRPLANQLVPPSPEVIPGGRPGAVGVPALPIVPAAPGKGMSAEPVPLPAYTLKAVMIGGGFPPSALLSVGGRTLLVGLNQVVPGNARVKSIKTDYVILSANGRDTRLNLKR